MALQMLESADLIKIENVCLHIFADPGVGRTTLGNMAEKVLLIDYDNGVHRALGRQRVVRLDSWEDMEGLLKHPWMDECLTPVIDTVGRALELLTRSILTGKDGATYGSLSTGPNQRGWGVLRNRFQAFFSELRLRHKNVINLSHAKLEKDTDGKKTAVPDIQGGSAGEVFKVSDAIGYMEMRGGRRVLDFNITDGHIGKNPPGWEPLLVPDYAKAPRFLQEGVISPLIKHLNSLSEEQAAVLKDVSVWQATVEGLDADPQTFTDLILGLNKIAHPAVKAQAKGMLARRAKLLGFEFDKATTSYVKPATQKDPGAYAKPAEIA